MIVKEKNGIRILCPNYGYCLRNIETGDVHNGKIYLGINVCPTMFEEVRDITVNETLFDTISEVQNKEQSLTKIGKIVANNITDDAVALTVQEFYDIWKAGETYNVGRYLQYENTLYKVLQEHTSQETWTPDVATSIYSKVLVDPSGETILDWVQPDSTNPYMIGDKVRFEGAVYECIVNNNIWNPVSYPAGWKLIEEV
jgi:hypothetical protein